MERDARAAMWWVVFWLVVLAIGAAGTIASINSIRFSRQVAREARDLTALSRTPPPVDDAQLSSLPAPVNRYLAKALGGARPAMAGARLRHGGLFRPSLDGSWLPIRGEQYLSADPPAFVWWGRVRLFPGVWIDARDRSTAGAGSMLVRVESTITLADRAGPELDQGALLRLLGEMAWLPATFADPRYVSWSPIDDRHARATLTVAGRAVSGEFEFGADDLPAAFAAERFRDLGGGRSVLTPFVGRLGGFRRVDGMLVPHRLIGAWVVDGRPIEYANFEVEAIAYLTSPPPGRPSDDPIRPGTRR